MHIEKASNKGNGSDIHGQLPGIMSGRVHGFNVPEIRSPEKKFGRTCMYQLYKCVDRKYERSEGLFIVQP